MDEIEGDAGLRMEVGLRAEATDDTEVDAVGPATAVRDEFDFLCLMVRGVDPDAAAAAR